MSNNSIQFTSLGSVGEVGASAHILTIDGLQILLDCGMHPSKEGASKLPDFSMFNRPPDAVIISHSHIDHCGSLPHLLNLFPDTPIYCTPPTLRIIDRMLHNCVSVMGKIRDERNIPEYPLYTHDDVDFALRRVYDIHMYKEFALHPDKDIRVMFTHAGHVLGSASVKITAPDHNVFYTGDVCTVDQELMEGYRPPKNSDSIDTLIIESTYGATPDSDAVDYKEEIERFGKAIASVLEEDGVALIPSFALGRTQEVLNMISRLQDENKLPYVPVYASGLGRAVYEIYDDFFDHLKPEAVLSPLDEFMSVGNVWNPKVARKLISDPCIIVATSGMMLENTPSAMIAQHLVQQPRNAIFFVGYCAEDTLGATVKEAAVGDSITFELNGDPVVNTLENIQSFQFSAHASRSALRDIVDSIPSKNIVFVHGDPPALEWMEYNTGDGRNKFVPSIGQTITLEG
jgi:Cft2 family RNA processing exonuclease